MTVIDICTNPEAHICLLFNGREYSRTRKNEKEHRVGKSAFLPFCMLLLRVIHNPLRSHACMMTNDMNSKANNCHIICETLYVDSGLDMVMDTFCFFVFIYCGLSFS